MIGGVYFSVANSQLEPVLVTSSTLDLLYARYLQGIGPPADPIPLPPFLGAPPPPPPESPPEAPSPPAGVPLAELPDDLAQPGFGPPAVSIPLPPPLLASGTAAACEPSCSTTAACRHPGRADRAVTGRSHPTGIRNGGRRAGRGGHSDVRGTAQANLPLDSEPDPWPRWRGLCRSLLRQPHSFLTSTAYLVGASCLSRGDGDMNLSSRHALRSAIGHCRPLPPLPPSCHSRPRYSAGACVVVVRTCSRR